MAPLRAAIYARVSSSGQRDRHTIRSQVETLPKWAEAQGWTVAGVYTDDGKTAKSGHLEARDGFARLLADAAAGKFQVVVVVDLDRVTRADDLAERGRIYGAFQTAGVQLATPSMGLVDTRTFLGDVLVSVYAGVAAEENRKRRERTVRGKIEAIRQGRKPSGPTPYGWTYSKITRTWALHPERSEVVRSIFEAIADGESCYEIAMDLERRGVPRPRRGAWSRERVWSIARATTARGVWLADKERGLTIPVPPIVDEGLWQRTQDALVAHGKRGLRRTKHVYLLEALAVCGLCGGRIRIASHSSPGRGHRRAAYYVCSGRWESWGGAGCPLPLQRVDLIDPAVWADVMQVLGDPAILEAALASRVSPEDGARARADLLTAERQLAEADRRSARISDSYRRGVLSDAAWAMEQDAASRHRALLERQVETARALVITADRVESTASEARSVVARMRTAAVDVGPEGRREMVRALLPRGAVLRPDGVSLGLAIPGPVCSASASGSSTSHQNVEMLRVVRTR